MTDDKHRLQVTSAQNPRVKEVVRLRQRRERDKSGLFLVEGYRELLRASDSSTAFQELFICPELFLGENESALIAKLQGSGARIIEASESVFRKMSYRDRPDGLLAIARQNHNTLTDLDKLLKGNDRPFLVVAEAIEKPGNLGTILRSADASGVDAVIVVDRCTDIHNPNVVRASVGTLFTVPVVEASGEEALLWLQERGILVAAATPAAEQAFTEAPLSGPVAIALGTEQLGLSERWMERADIQVRIPM